MKKVKIEKIVKEIADKNPLGWINFSGKL